MEEKHSVNYYAVALFALCVSCSAPAESGIKGRTASITEQLSQVSSSSCSWKLVLDLHVHMHVHSGC